jgi:hypothetical protein
MQPDQRSNLDTAARAVGESLAAAWAHFHLLRGLDNGRRKHPQVVEHLDLLYDRLWRSAFDAFFAKVGTLLDNKRGNRSLLSFLTLARRYVDAEVTRVLPAIEVELASNDAPLAKLQRWRHEVVAHKPATHDAAEFHAQYKMTLTEIEGALGQLDQYFNQISWNVLGLHSEHRSCFEGVVEQAESLFAAAAAGLSKEAQ